MALKNFYLVLHILGAIAFFGPSFVFPVIGAMAKKEGAPIAWLLRISDKIEHLYLDRLGTIIQPATGAALILISDNPALQPFERQGRWLLASIIIFIVATVIGVAILGPAGKRAIVLADANDFGPEFGGLMKKIQMFGQVETVFLLTIIILMVVKPGSGFVHP